MLPLTNLRTPFGYASYVIVGTQGGNLCVFDSQTGVLLTTLSLNNQLINHLGYDYQTNILYATAFDFAPTLANFRLYAIDIYTSEVIWQQPTMSYASKPLGWGGSVYLSFLSDAQLHAFESTSGTQKWQVSYNDGFALGRPFVADDQLFVVGRTSAYALDVSDGSLIWASISTGGVLFADDIWVGTDNVYASAGSYVYAFSRNTGEVQWQSPAIPYNLTGPAAAPGVPDANTTLYVADTEVNSQNRLHAIHPSTGNLIWTSSAVIGSKDQITLAPTVTLDAIHAATMLEGVISRINAGTGGLVATYAVDGNIEGLSLQ